MRVARGIAVRADLTYAAGRMQQLGSTRTQH